jgi:hypothetical protein
MITVWNGHRNYLHLSASAHPGKEHPPQSWKIICWQLLLSTINFWLSRDWKRILFLTNNAGMLLKTKDRRGKDQREAGMSMKTKALSHQMRECC